MYTAYKALPTSGKAIAKYARSIRNDIGLVNTYFFPVMKFLEHVLPQAFPDMSLEIVPPQDMPFKEGETIPGQNILCIRQKWMTDFIRILSMAPPWLARPEFPCSWTLGIRRFRSV